MTYWVLMAVLCASVWLYTSNPPRSFASVFGLVFVVMIATRLTVTALLS